MDTITIIEGFKSSELLLIGILLLAGWFAHSIGQFVHVPRVTILLILGIVAGPFFLNLIPSEMTEWFPQVTHLALSMVGFLLGESFAGREFKESGRTVIFVSIGETIGAALIVFFTVLLLQGNLILALLLAGIAPASAPAATLDVIRENHAKGPVTKTVLGVVAIDDAWGVILFSILLVFAEALSGQGTALTELSKGLWEIFGAIFLGILFGIPMSFLTGRLKKGEPSILEAMGFVFICGGAALALNVSYLLACIVLGATVANFGKHHTRPFRDIEGAIEPFLVTFFLLAGFECNLTVLKTLSALGVAYVFARSFGLITGGNIAARMIDASPMVQSHVGWCLLPQAGVALGLALLCSERLPQLADTILPLVIGTTVIFEIGGPLITRWHLKKAGEL